MFTNTRPQLIVTFFINRIWIIFVQDSIQETSIRWWFQYIGHRKWRSLSSPSVCLSIFSSHLRLWSDVNYSEIFVLNESRTITPSGIGSLSPFDHISISGHLIYFEFLWGSSRVQLGANFEWVARIQRAEIIAAVEIGVKIPTRRRTFLIEIFAPYEMCSKDWRLSPLFGLISIVSNVLWNWLFHKSV